ncbi:hypothetical protein ACFL5G_01575 [Candidatus Margulisiibacteriota bacterium]
MEAKIISLPYISRLKHTIELLDLDINRAKEQGSFKQPDKRLWMKTSYGIGLRSPLNNLWQFLARLDSRIGSLNILKIFDVGSFLGDTGALFSRLFKEVSLIEGDSKMMGISKKRLKLLQSSGLVDLAKIRFQEGDCLSEDVKFKGADIIYNYCDKCDTDVEHVTPFYTKLTEKIIAEANQGVFLITLNASDTSGIQKHMRNVPSLNKLIGTSEFLVFQRR